MSNPVGPQGRMQLGLNVGDLDAAIEFYRNVFGVEPAKVRPGYANFAIAEPPLKMVLFASEKGGTINHLGVEVDSTERVVDATRHLISQGLTTEEQVGTDCCYALQDKVWVRDPDGLEWEWYTVLADTEQADDGACCVTEETTAACC